MPPEFTHTVPSLTFLHRPFFFFLHTGHLVASASSKDVAMPPPSVRAQRVRSMERREGEAVSVRSKLSNRELSIGHLTAERHSRAPRLPIGRDGAAHVAPAP